MLSLLNEHKHPDQCTFQSNVYLHVLLEKDEIIVNALIISMAWRKTGLCHFL